MTALIELRLMLLLAYAYTIFHLDALQHVGEYILTHSNARVSAALHQLLVNHQASLVNHLRRIVQDAYRERRSGSTEKDTLTFIHLLETIYLVCSKHLPVLWWC